MTLPVGMKKTNEPGTYDMSGNAWKWCSDWYIDSNYVVCSNQNPAGPAKDPLRIMRGGGWFQDSLGLNKTFSKAMNPE